MRGEKEKHVLDGTYTITEAVGDGARYETVGDRITLQQIADDPDKHVYCQDHHGRFRYRHLTWGEKAVEGSLVELPDHVNRGHFRIELAAETPDGLKQVQCVFGIGPTEPGSWTAEETGTGGGSGGPGLGDQGGQGAG